MEHALSCARGGFPTIRHNEIRDITAHLMRGGSAGYVHCSSAGCIDGGSAGCVHCSSAGCVNFIAVLLVALMVVLLVACIDCVLLVALTSLQFCWLH